MAFCNRESCTSANSAPANPHALVTISSGVRFPTNIARTCCKPKGIACASGMSPSNENTPSDLVFSGVSFEDSPAGSSA